MLFVSVELNHTLDTICQSVDYVFRVNALCYLEIVEDLRVRLPPAERAAKAVTPVSEGVTPVRDAD